jgi:hypothetical protein
MDFDPCLCCGKMEMLINSSDIVASFGRFCANNLTKVIVGSLFTYDGLSKFDSASKLVCFEVDGVITFQGSKIGVTVELKKNHALLMLGVHCAACRINSVV